MTQKDKSFKSVPQHVAIIMDGNGRWAQQRYLPRTQGHVEGMRRVEDLVEFAPKLGVKYLTLFTFSTENWSRPESEVNMLMNMLMTVLNNKINKLKEDNIRFQTIGRRDKIPSSVMNAMDRVVAETSHNDGLYLNLAFNYGSRIEIVDAVQNIAKEVMEGKLKPESIDEETISTHLYTKNIPDPDLLIRTSGEKRISNFLLWQLSYAEFYFTDKCWPEFTPDEFKKAIEDFQKRERRYGNVGGSAS